MTTCICNDETSTKQITCLNCKSTWNRPKYYQERVSECPLHHSTIAICSFPSELCDSCKNQGYYIEPGFGFMPSEIKKY